MNLIKKWWFLRKRKKQLAKAPKDLGAAMLLLDSLMDDAKRAEFAKEPASSPGSYLHFTGGLAMRNSWGLWDKNQPLTKWFRERGVWHADDMSAIIYRAYWCFLNDVPFNILQEAEYYRAYWEMTGLGFDGVELT